MNREAADLTEALRGLPGVADAELAADSAEGVRVRLSADADPTDVAAAVRDVLAEHGLKGKMAPPQAHIEPSGPPPPPSATILPGPGLVQTTLVPEETIEDPADDLDAFMRSPEPIARPSEQYSDPEPAGVVESAPAPDPSPLPGLNRGLVSRVRVQEDRDGVAVTVDTDDDRTVTRRGRPSDAGVREAVVAAVGELSGDQPPPVLLAAEEHELGEHRMITVLLQRHDGSFHVGSALVGAEKAFALARAAWAAMSQAT
jgi:hypothetical protein